MEYYSAPKRKEADTEAARGNSVRLRVRQKDMARGLGTARFTGVDRGLDSRVVGGGRTTFVDTKLPFPPRKTVDSTRGQRGSSRGSRA